MLDFVLKLKKVIRTQLFIVVLIRVTYYRVSCKMLLVLNTLEISARCFCEYSNGFGDKRGILCGRTENYHQVAECPKDHWCTGNSNKSSEVVSAMDLCEKGNINTRQKEILEQK